MTGMRPDTLRVWGLKKHFREEKPKVITLPQWFKKHGYHTHSIGKIYLAPANLRLILPRGRASRNSIIAKRSTNISCPKTAQAARRRAQNPRRARTVIISMAR